MSKPQPSRLADKYQTYSTAREAAVAALRGINEKSFECGGGILYNKEQNVYAATEPTGQNNDAHFSASVSVPQGWSLHSTYHTHPSGPSSTKFSDDDINTAQQLKAPSYILARDDNKIRMFDPANSKMSQDSSAGLLSSSKISNGSLVDETPSTPPTITSPTVAPTVAATSAPIAAIPVTGSRVTMKEFVARHRAQTTQYRHKIVHIK